MITPVRHVLSAISGHCFSPDRDCVIKFAKKTSLRKDFNNLMKYLIFNILFLSYRVEEQCSVKKFLLGNVKIYRFIEIFDTFASQTA